MSAPAEIIDDSDANIKVVTRLINGGYIGLKDRTDYTKEAYKKLK